MSGSLQFLLGFGVSASAAILLALGLTALLRQKASARSLYIAWLAVLAAALIPLRPFRAPAPVAIPVAIPAVTVPRQVAIPRPAGTAPMDLPVVEYTPTPRPISAETILWGVYAAGLCASLAIQLTGHARCMRRLRRWRTAPQDGTHALYQLTAREMGITHLPRLYICPAAESPMAVGVLRPCVYLPDENLTPKEMRLILRHELVHCRRGDLPVKALALLATAVHWYNPLIYAMRRGLEYACEASCDERVMQGRSLEERAYYSEIMVAVIRRRSRMRTALSTTFYGGKRGMKNRILSIMNTGRRRLGALVLCPVLLAACLGVAFANEPAKPTPELMAVATPTPMPSPMPMSSTALEAFFREDGDPMTPEEARGKAMELYLTASDNPWQAEGSVLKSYEIKPVQLPWGTFEAAVVDIAVSVTPTDGGPRDEIWRAYLTPVSGKPLLLRVLNDNEQESESAYWINRLLSADSYASMMNAYLPAPAVVSADAGGVGLCYAPTDYDVPVAVLLNGTPVTVICVQYMENNVPQLTDGAMIYWAYVQAGPAEGQGGAMGWMPLMTLQLGGEARARYIGAVKADTATGFVNLLGCCDDKGQVLIPLSSGTDVQILGRYARYYQVQAGEDVGFLPVEQLLPDTSAAAQLNKVMPQRFDSAQPERISYAAYMERIAAFYDQYGDPNDWTLEQAAQVSQFRQSYGYDADLDVHILPGADDLSREEAERIAQEAVLREYGVSNGGIEAIRASLYYRPDDSSQTHLWKIRFSTAPGLRDCSATIDNRGRVVETWQDTLVNRRAEPPAPEDTVDYYFNHGKALSDEATDAIIDTAYAYYCLANPDAQGRDDYWYVVSNACSREDPDFVWSCVTVEPHEDYMPFYRVVILPDRVLADDPQAYRVNLELGRQIRRQQELEGQYGPTYTWTVEQKAQYSEELPFAIYKLPEPGDISQEQALACARQALVKQAGLSMAELSMYHPFFAYAWYEGESHADAYLWRVDFYTQAAMTAGPLDGYIVWLEPQTGEVVDLWEPGGNG